MTGNRDPTGGDPTTKIRIDTGDLGLFNGQSGHSANGDPTGGIAASIPSAYDPWDGGTPAPRSATPASGLDAEPSLLDQCGGSEPAVIEHVRRTFEATDAEAA